MDVPPDEPQDVLPVEPGTLIGGKYRVVRLIAKGGMGAVVEATHERLKTRVAIKLVLPSVIARKTDAKDRFLKEAWAAARLDSDYVGRIRDIDTLEDGSPFIVMDYLEGKSLDVVIESGPPLTVEEAVDLVLQVLCGLSVAHQAGIVHRDLKPSNLMLTTTSEGNERVKIIDFGIAKICNPEDEALSPSTTATRSVLGSPGYIAPEQIGASKHVDVRADIWSVGVILWELLAGARLWEGDSVGEILMRILGKDAPSVSRLRPDVPEALDAAVARCLQRDAAERFPSVKALMFALAPFGSKRQRAALRLTESTMPPPLLDKVAAPSRDTMETIDAPLAATEFPVATSLHGDAPPSRMSTAAWALAGLAVCGTVLAFGLLTSAPEPLHLAAMPPLAAPPAAPPPPATVTSTPSSTARASSSASASASATATAVAAPKRAPKPRPARRPPPPPHDFMDSRD